MDSIQPAGRYQRMEDGVFETSEIAHRNLPALGKMAISESAQEHAPRFSAAVLDNIVRETEPKLQRLAYHLVSNWDAACDVVQEAYTRAFDALREGRFRGESRLGTWLQSIVHNVAIDARKKQQGLRVTHSDIALIADREESDPRYTVEKEEEQRYQSRRVHDALRTISDEQHIALQLFYFWDLSYKAIAEEVQVAVGTIQSRMHYGKKKLKQLLAECVEAA